MNIAISEQSGVTVLAFDGRLDGTHAQEAEAAFQKQANEGRTRFVFDFTNMQYISSAGLRVVLIAAKRVRTVNGRLVCAGMSESVAEVFEIAGFSSILHIVETVQEAVLSLRED